MIALDVPTTAKACEEIVRRPQIFAEQLDLARRETAIDRVLIER